MIHKLMTTTEEIIKLLMEERNLLKARKLIQAGQLHETKDSLNDEYQLLVLQVKNNRQLMENLSAEERQRLYDTTSHMKALLKENEKLLDVVTASANRLTAAFVAHFTSHVPAVESYSRFGAHVKSRMAKTAALTVSKAV